jgi:hypothetical protein
VKGLSCLIALASAAAIPAAWAWGGWLIAGGHVKNGVFFVTMVPVILVLFIVMFGQAASGAIR